MNARMEKYNVDNKVKQRTKKNENLYSQIGDMNIDYVDINVNNAVEFDSRRGVSSSREDYQRQREFNKLMPNNRERLQFQDDYVEPKEDRVYDINEILDMARQNKLFEDSEKKRLINTEYNILTKLDIDKLENEDMKKEDLRSLIDNIYENEKPQKPKMYKRSEEAKLLKDLFDDVDDDDNEIELQEELSKNILDTELNGQKDDDKIGEVATQILPDQDLENSMYQFDFGKKSSKEKKVKETNDNENDFIEEEEGNALVIAIVVVVVLILITCGFFVYEYFFGI